MEAAAGLRRRRAVEEEKKKTLCEAFYSHLLVKVETVSEILLQEQMEIKFLTHNKNDGAKY